MTRPKYTKDVVVEVSMYDLEGPIEGIERKLYSFAEDKNVHEPKLRVTGWDYAEAEIYGWRPMTDAEIEKSKTASKRAKDAATRRREKKEAEERAEYERLRAKFEAEGIG